MKPRDGSHARRPAARTPVPDPDAASHAVGRFSRLRHAPPHQLQPFGTLNNPVQVTSSLPSRIVGATDAIDDSIIHWVRPLVALRPAPRAPRALLLPSLLLTAAASVKCKPSAHAPAPSTLIFQGLVEEGKGPVKIGEEYFMLKRVKVRVWAQDVLR